MSGKDDPGGGGGGAGGAGAHKKIMHALQFFYSLNIFGKSNLTHWTTDVMFSGQPFAIFTMFFLLWQERGSILH